MKDTHYVLQEKIFGVWSDEFSSGSLILLKNTFKEWTKQEPELEYRVLKITREVIE